VSLCARQATGADLGQNIAGKTPTRRLSVIREPEAFASAAGINSGFLAFPAPSMALIDVVDVIHTISSAEMQYKVPSGPQTIYLDLYGSSRTRVSP
jgi:hypothetical protein